MYRLLHVQELPVHIYPRTKREVGVSARKCLGCLSLQTQARFTDHTDLKTKHFILKKENQAVSLNMAHNQSLDPGCSTQPPRLPHEYAFNGTFITNNKQNGSCGGTSRKKCSMEKGFAINPSAPHPSLISSRTTLLISLHLVQTEFLSTAPQFFFLLNFLPSNSCSSADVHFSLP